MGPSEHVRVELECINVQTRYMGGGIEKADQTIDCFAVTLPFYAPGDRADVVYQGADFLGGKHHQDAIPQHGLNGTVDYMGEGSLEGNTLIVDGQSLPPFEPGCREAAQQGLDI